MAQSGGRPRRCRRSGSRAGSRCARRRARPPSASDGRAPRRAAPAPRASAAARRDPPPRADRRQQRAGGVEARRARSRRRRRATAGGRRDCSENQWLQPEPHPAAPSGASSSATWNEWPHPHEATAFGFSILKPDSWRPSMKSTVAPWRYGALNGSTTTWTPCWSDSMSPSPRRGRSRARTGSRSSRRPGSRPAGPRTRRPHPPPSAAGSSTAAGVGVRVEEWSLETCRARSSPCLGAMVARPVAVLIPLRGPGNRPTL